MPIYEYKCTDCHRKFSRLVGSIDAPPPPCKYCNSSHVARLISRFARHKSEEDTLDSLAEKLETADESNPTALRQMAKEMSSELGEEISDEEIESILEGDDTGSDDDG